jgi:hypothetical protein
LLIDCYTHVPLELVTYARIPIESVSYTRMPIEPVGYTYANRISELHLCQWSL